MSDHDTSEAAVFRKVSLRLLPFLFLLYVINLIDRTNIGIARLQMVDQQNILDEEAYSLGAGIFYVGYLLFEVTPQTITGTYFAVPRPQEPWSGPSIEIDKFTLDLKTHQIIQQGVSKQ